MVLVVLVAQVDPEVHEHQGVQMVPVALGGPGGPQRPSVPATPGQPGINLVDLVVQLGLVGLEDQVALEVQVALVVLVDQQHPMELLVILAGPKWSWRP